MMSLTMSSTLFAAMSSMFVYLLMRLLNLTAPSLPPKIYAKDISSEFIQRVLSMCPILSQPYIPTFLWGKSGHIQTIMYAKMGRLSIPLPDGHRHTHVMDDGATLTFDMFDSKVPHKTGGNYCILICPGIGNSSESNYIQSLVHHAINNGYKCVVLNHIGALKNEALSAPRIFTYGGTEELAIVRSEVEHLYPECNLLLVGLSMGANIVVKYLGESPYHQHGIVAAISLCQGYDVNKAKDELRTWKNLRRGYIYAMTKNQKNILKRHKNILLSDNEMRRIGLEDERKVFSATLLHELDEVYTRKRCGFNTLEDFYSHQSSSHYILDVNTPLLIVNAEDDPIVPETLLAYPLQAAQMLPHCIYVLTKFGGHLGFFENGWLFPNTVTWMDRVIVDYSDALTVLHHSGELRRFTFRYDSSSSSSSENLVRVASDIPIRVIHPSGMAGPSNALHKCQSDITLVRRTFTNESAKLVDALDRSTISTEVYTGVGISTMD